MLLLLWIVHGDSMEGKGRAIVPFAHAVPATGSNDQPSTPSTIGAFSRDNAFWILQWILGGSSLGCMYKTGGKGKDRNNWSNQNNDGWAGGWNGWNQGQQKRGWQQANQDGYTSR